MEQAGAIARLAVAEDTKGAGGAGPSVVLALYVTALERLLAAAKAQHGSLDRLPAGLDAAVKSYMQRAEALKTQGVRPDPAGAQALIDRSAGGTPAAGTQGKAKQEGGWLNWLWGPPGGDGGGGGDGLTGYGGRPMASTSVTAADDLVVRRPLGSQLAARPAPPGRAPASAPAAGAAGAAPAAAGAAGGLGRATSAPAVVSALTAEEQKVVGETLLRGGSGVGWAQVAGLQLAKRMLQEAVIEPMLNPGLYTGLRAPPKGVLMFGPPGTGKTMLAKAVAAESGAAFLAVSASTLTSKWVGEGEKNVRALFSAARKLAPAVMFIDEIDSLLTSRSAGDNEASRRLKTEFLVQMDGVSGGEGDRVMLLAATNLPQELDDAVIRRFPARVYIPLPDEEARHALLGKLLQGETSQISRDKGKRIVTWLNGYSCSDIRAVAQEAAKGPLREWRSQHGGSLPVAATQLRPMKAKDFQEAIRVVRPSVPPGSLRQYQQWNAQFGVSGTG